MCAQEPLRFLALHGSMQLARHVHVQGCLAPAAVPLVAALRDILQLREPTSATMACTVLTQMCAVNRPFCQAVIPHFWQLGGSLALFYGMHEAVDFGYTSRKVCSMHEVVDEVLCRLFEGAGQGGAALRAIQRHVPLFCPAV